VNKLGAALCRIAKFLGGERVDASAASVSRLEYGHSFTCASKQAGSHQARSASTNDQKIRQI
jgi:hypothetical protein